MLKDNNKNTRATSLTCFTTFSIASIVEFEQANVISDMTCLINNENKVEISF